VLIFYGSMIIGLLALICSHFGYLFQFILVFVVSIGAQFAYEKLINRIVRQEKSDAIDNATNAIMELMKQQKEESEKRQEKANNVDFLAKGLIPIRVDEETGAYVVELKDVVEGIDVYLGMMEEKIAKYELQKYPEEMHPIEWFAEQDSKKKNKQ